MSSFRSDAHPRSNGSTVFLDGWGDAIRWRCGHERVVIGVHEVLDHDHACPQCHPGVNRCGITFTGGELPDDRPQLEI